MREKLCSVVLGEEALYLEQELSHSGGKEVEKIIILFPDSALLNWCTYMYAPTNTESKRGLQSLGKNLAIFSGLKVEIRLCFAHLGCKNILIV